ncbi:hemerythrin domain-containing protein [Shewanella metallivivens]|uniref:Hemerythrin domain-containing protein n=1 Tax=Shewanella metallivivens TaxID=2872342 RepID=A0ABT5TR07_9GAMM|nr:hemerythrin domain-containing protein [Shewanella metallivivens]MDD8061045.1 hemerythrin domain-containing protein [Shewanella metallivivens]
MLAEYALPALQQLSLLDLIDHIEATHHQYIRDTAPLLVEYTEKMVHAHGDDHSEIKPLAHAVNQLIAELMPHLMKEERILFPAIRSLCLGQPSTCCFGHVGNPIKMMQHEHDNAEHILQTIRQITNNYTPPEGACSTWKTCYRTLAEFDTDLQAHIDVEDTLLFSKTLNLQSL